MFEARPFSGPRYQENSSRCKDSPPCCVCGKAVKNPNAPMVRVLDGGDRFGREDEKEGTGDPGDMGAFPVGPECASKLRKAGVFLF